MTSNSKKDQFRAEYFQAKIRLDDLNNFIEKYDRGNWFFNPVKDIDAIGRQAEIMTEYVKVMEARAIAEDIDFELYIGEKTVVLKKPTGEWLDEVNDKAERVREQLYEIRDLIESLHENNKNIDKLIGVEPNDIVRL